MFPNGGYNVKWITAASVLLFLLMTSALVTTKVSLLWILRLYKYEQIHPATWYVFIAVLLEAPLLTHVVHIVWNTPFIYGDRRPLPKKLFILLGILGSVSESVAIAVFASEISYLLPEPVLLMLPATVITLHAIIQTSHRIKEQASDDLNKSDRGDAGKSKGRRSLVNCLGILMSSYLFWTPAGVAAILYSCSSFNVGLWGTLALPIVVLVLSATWSPHLQSTVITARVKGQEFGPRNSMLSLVYASFRVVTIPATLFVIMFFRIESFRCDIVGFMTHVVYDVTDSRVWLPLLVTCLFGLVTVMIAGVASKVALTNPGVRLPALATPAATLAFATLLWRDLESEAFWELSGDDVFAWTASGVVLLAWLATFALPGVALVKTPRTFFRPFAENFFAFSWRPFFLEQFAMLNTQVPEDAEDEDMSDARNAIAECSGKKGVKRVFICTTMYRETEVEMRRYLNSLKRAFMSSKLQDTAIEAHIFLDNCVTETSDVNGYARQLLTLITQVLHVTPQALVRHATPYGCQVSCCCIGGKKLFVHCKDGRKFKIKKRWSQVMYMRYILDHRARCAPQTVSPPRELSSTKEKNPFSGWNIMAGSGSSGDALHEAAKPEASGSVWFCSEQMLPSATTESLRKILSEPQNSLSSVEACHKNDCKLLSLLEQRHLDESGSESAFGSDAWNDIYAAAASSMESTTSGNCSDAEDESSLTTLRGTLAATSRLTEQTVEEWRNGSSGLSTVNLASNAGRGTGIVDQSCVPLQSLLTSGMGVPDTAMYSLFGDHTEDTHAREQPSTTWYSGTRGRDDDVYILATDADTEFSGGSVRVLLDLCNADRSLGAACGRTVPVGGLKPIVWYQKFEYAKDFWLVKSSQNVIGSVTCCPGCFSLYRGSALRDVMTTFSSPSQSAYDTLVKDHGEDRWLCTLLMQQGWKLEYADKCRNSTHCPETCGEFMRQRRRWVLSELSNMMLIFQGLWGLVKSNAAFSAMFVLSLLHMFVWVLLSPSTTLVVTCVSFHVLYHLPVTYTAPAAYGVILIYFVLCVTQPRQTQRLVTQAIVLLMAGVMVAVSVGFVQYVIDTLQTDVAQSGGVKFKPYFLVLVLIIATVYAALLHASEGYTLVYGLVYAAIFPSMFLTLPIYSVANMVDTSWGTREGAPSKSCCQSVLVDQDESGDKETTEFHFKTRDLQPLSAGDPAQLEEHRFWNRLKETVLGCEVNCGETERNLRRDLFRLRTLCVAVVFILNSAWYVLLTAVYVFVDNDVVCYVIASLFSFSLVVQLLGMTSYKMDEFFKTYLVKKMPRTGPVWVREKF